MKTELIRFFVAESEHQRDADTALEIRFFGVGIIFLLGFYGNADFYKGFEDQGSYGYR